MFRLTRERKIGEKVETETIYGIASPTPQRADPKALLKFTREHWGIESMHYVRDVTLGEDASRIRKGSGPEVMACLRNIVIFLLNRLKFTNTAAATRHFVCHPEKTLALVSTPI